MKNSYIFLFLVLFSIQSCVVWESITSEENYYDRDYNEEDYEEDYNNIVERDIDQPIRHRNTNSSTYRRSTDEDNSCYAKLLFQKSEDFTYAVFTGDPSSEDVELLEINIDPPRTAWVKKKADKNCFSQNPDDCLVWCLTEVGSEDSIVLVVKDTSQTKNYEIKNINIKDYSINYTDWVEVLCEQEISVEFITALQSKLFQIGYLKKIDYSLNTLDASLKVVLSEYQRNNNLPIGDLDFETLRSLELGRFIR